MSYSPHPSPEWEVELAQIVGLLALVILALRAL